MFDHAVPTFRLDSSVRLHSDVALLNVQLLQVPAPFRHLDHAIVGDCVTSFDTEFAQVNGVFSKSEQCVICDVTLSNIE